MIQTVNRLLKPIGLTLRKSGKRDMGRIFTMREALVRLASHNIPIGTIIDIGASDGKWSSMAMSLFPDSAVMAIEPLEERRAALERMKAEYDRFDYTLCAAGPKDEEVMLSVAEDLDGSAVEGSSGESRKVPSMKVDSIIAEKGLKAPFLLKFDTHGFELPILEGAVHALEKANVVIMEVYNFNISDRALRFHEMCTLLEERGLRCFDMSEPRLRKYDSCFWQMDLFFARKQFSIFNYNGYR